MQNLWHLSDTQQAAEIRRCVEGAWHDWTRKRRCVGCGVAFTHASALFESSKCRTHPMMPRDKPRPVYNRHVSASKRVNHYPCCSRALSRHDIGHNATRLTRGCTFTDHLDNISWQCPTNSKRLEARFYNKGTFDTASNAAAAKRLEVIPLFMVENLAREFANGTKLEREPQRLKVQLEGLLHRRPRPDGTSSVVLVDDPSFILSSHHTKRRMKVASGTQTIEFDAQDAYLSMTHTYGLPTRAFTVEGDPSAGDATSATSLTSRDPEIQGRIDSLMSMFSDAAGGSGGEVGHTRDRQAHISSANNVSDYSYFDSTRGEWNSSTRAIYDTANTQTSSNAYYATNLWEHVESESSDDDDEIENISTVRAMINYLRPSVSEKSFYPFVVYPWISGERIPDLGVSMSDPGHDCDPYLV